MKSRDEERRRLKSIAMTGKRIENNSFIEDGVSFRFNELLDSLGVPDEKGRYTHIAAVTGYSVNTIISWCTKDVIPKSVPRMLDVVRNIKNHYAPDSKESLNDILAYLYFGIKPKSIAGNFSIRSADAASDIWLCLSILFTKRTNGDPSSILSISKQKKKEIIMDIIDRGWADTNNFDQKAFYDEITKPRSKKAIHILKAIIASLPN